MEILKKSGKENLSEKIKEIFTDCKGCGAKCCKYVILPLPDRSYNYLQYLLYHNVFLFVDFEAKSIDSYIISDCVNLNDKEECSIYETRPDICKEHAELVCFENKIKVEDVVIIKTIEDLEKYKDEIEKWNED